MKEYFPSGFICFSMILIYYVVLSHSSIAQDQSDDLASAILFEEQHHPGSVLWTHRMIADNTPEKYFNDLQKWVFPNTSGANFRLDFDFLPTFAAPAVIQEYAIHPANEGNRIEIGGTLIAPMFSLIDAASELKKTEELRATVDNSSTDTSPESQLNRLAVLILISLKEKHDEWIKLYLEEFLSLAHNNVDMERGPTQAEWLVVTRLSQSKDYSREVSDLVYRYEDWATAWTFPSVERQQWLKLMGLVKPTVVSQLREHDFPPTTDSLTTWQPVSRLRAKMCGQGRPPARWDMQGGYVENLSSHDQDFLYFNTPLRGDFEIECDVTTNNYSDTQVMVGGYWAGPIYSRTKFYSGTHRRPFGQEKLPFNLTREKGWSRYRVVVRENSATTYFNGRKLKSFELAENFDPWIAIRSGVKQDGCLRNFAITGEPVIPDQIEMFTGADLDNWIGYYGESVYEADGTWAWRDNRLVSSSWRGETLEQMRTSLRKYPGAAAYERLLRYHRPLLEDGSIRYEFYYEPDTFVIHPAIGRTAFIIDEDAVRLHWITDGEYDRTSLSPENVTELPEEQLLVDGLPLKSERWNEMDVQLIGNVVTLVLNGTPIYRRQIEPTNQRLFGFFYYADKSVGIVRNTIHTGAWPKSLPSVQQQEMAYLEDAILEENDSHLKERYEHDFSLNQSMTDFNVYEGIANTNFDSLQQGLRVTRHGKGGYLNATLTPHLNIGGDFDVIAEFTQLDQNPIPNGKAAALLTVTMDNETQDEFICTRHTLLSEDGEFSKFSQGAYVIRTKEGDRRKYPFRNAFESNVGKIRLARRGNRMYYLHAEDDSVLFQLDGIVECDDVDVRSDGIKLINQIYGKGGSSTIVWKKLTVLAERLGGSASGGVEHRLAQLRTERENLPVQIEHNFAETSPAPRFSFRRGTAGWSPNEAGWQIDGQGDADWTASGVHFLAQITGDFDASVKLQVHHLPVIVAGRGGAVYWRIKPPTEEEKVLSVILQQKVPGVISASTQSRYADDEAGVQYGSFGSAVVNNISELILTRRGDRLYCSAFGESSGQEYLIGETEIDSRPIAVGDLCLMVHSGIPGEDTAISLKSISVSAEEIQFLNDGSPPAEE